MQFDLQPHASVRSALPAGASSPEAAPQPTVADIVRIIRRRLWVILVILCTALLAAGYLTRRTPPAWRAHAQLILVDPAGGGDASAQPGFSAPAAETVATQLTMLQDHEMAQRALKVISDHLRAQGQSAGSLGFSAPQIEKSITASSPQATNIIDVETDADSPQKAALLGNSVCEAFTAWKREVAQRNSEDALTNLEVRANRAKSALDHAENQELQFSEAHHLVDASAQSSGLLSQSLAADSNVEALRVEVSTEKTRLSTLGAQLKTLDQAIRGGTGVRDDTLVLGLQSQLSQLEIDRANEALKFRPKYPSVLPDLDAKIKDIQRRLALAVQGTLDNKKPSLQSQGTLFEQYTQAQVDVLISQAKLTAALALQAQLQQQTAGLPVINLTSERLAHNADLARSLYSALASGLNSARLQEDMVSGNVQVVQAADVPEAPFSPNPARNLLVGAAIGLALSVFAVMLLEQTDRRVQGLEGVRRLGGGSVAGVLTRMPRAEVDGLRRGEISPPVLEAFNLAGINLDLLLRRWDTELAPGGDVGGRTSFAAFDPSRIILVTSALPGEGKSMTAATLARCLARSGKRVILVNADLRRPMLDQMFPSESASGLADVLERRVALADALQRSDAQNLLVLHSGRVTDTPTNLLSRPVLAELMQELRGAGCTVLIDTPASAVVGDALLLAPYADCILHVVGVGQVEEALLERTTAALHAAAPGVLAYFVNREPREKRTGYESYYKRTTPAAALAVDSTVSGQGSRSVDSLWENDK